MHIIDGILLDKAYVDTISNIDIVIRLVSQIIRLFIHANYLGSKPNHKNL